MNYFQLLAKLFMVYESLEGKTVDYKIIVQKIKKAIPFEECNIIGNSSLSLATNSFIVAGLYHMDLDKAGVPSIDIEIVFPKRKESFTFDEDDVSKQHWGEFCTDFMGILGHEYMHLNQFRRRNFNWSRPYNSSCSQPALREQKNYYGNPDEIDAYAFMAAADMILAAVVKNEKSPPKIQKTHVYKTYTRFFDKADPVVVKLTKLSNRYFKRLEKQYYATPN